MGLIPFYWCVSMNVLKVEQLHMYLRWKINYRSARHHRSNYRVNLTPRQFRGAHQLTWWSRLMTHNMYLKIISDHKLRQYDVISSSMRSMMLFPDSIASAFVRRRRHDSWKRSDCIMEARGCRGLSPINSWCIISLSPAKSRTVGYLNCNWEWSMKRKKFGPQKVTIGRAVGPINVLARVWSRAELTVERLDVDHSFVATSVSWNILVSFFWFHFKLKVNNSSISLRLQGSLQQPAEESSKWSRWIPKRNNSIEERAEESPVWMRPKFWWSSEHVRCDLDCDVVFFFRICSIHDSNWYWNFIRFFFLCAFILHRCYRVRKFFWHSS